MLVSLARNIGRLSFYYLPIRLKAMISFRSLRSICQDRQPPQITLTEQEDRICHLLDDFTTELKKSRPDLPPVECRIAGGWVRDKLLGRESHDIDVALSTMMGVTFADLLVPFMESKGLATKSVHTIARNPDQSKHLETAKTEVLGLEVDFVNLRSEVYNEGSRIPSEIAFGTPKEDALRRDITINALFYNVHEREVEDLTNKGLNDLESGIIRTPLPPLETFSDDPLRVLRCLRFASRFGFKMADDLQEAAKDPKIKEALTTKISRERVGEELDKMLKGSDPLSSLQLIDNLELHPAIFWLPPALTPLITSLPGPRGTSLYAASILSLLLSPNESTLPSLHPELIGHPLKDHSTRVRLYLAAALTPYRGITYQEKKKTILGVEAVIREGLKFGTQNHYLDGIPALFAAAELLKHPRLDKYVDRPLRVALGLLLRDKPIHNAITGSHWSSSLLFSLVQELVPLWDAKTHNLQVTDAAQVIEIYNSFVTKIMELDLPSSLDDKPRLNGGEVAALLKIKPGPSTGQILNKVIEWQLENPTGTKADCSEWLKAEFSSGRLQVEDGKRPKNSERLVDDKPSKKPRKNG